jgi:3-dehydroquinate dehydratase II
MNILVIHGPNLNMLGKRDQKQYGNLTLEGLYDFMTQSFENIDFTFYQSNHEGEIIDIIQDAMNLQYDALIINPGALTHTSIALRDALEILKILKVEVHLSNINQRESFRATNYIKDVVDATFMGKQKDSYIEAILFLQSKIVV